MKISLSESKAHSRAIIILPGKSKGIESEFIKELFDESVNQGFSTITFDYPFYTRKSDKTSGDELQEEVEALSKAVEFLKEKGYQNFILIGKSLGGIVASYYLDRITETQQEKYNLVVLGFIIGGVKVENLKSSLKVIQGECDRFGNREIVEKFLLDKNFEDFELSEIKNADRSFRDTNGDDSVLGNLAIQKVFDFTRT